MNSNGSVQCEVLSNVSTIAYPTLVSDRMILVVSDASELEIGF